MTGPAAEPAASKRVDAAQRNGERDIVATALKNRVREGLPFPRGAHWDGKGVNFALFSANAEKVELCTFDPRGRREWRRRGRCC